MLRFFGDFYGVGEGVTVIRGIKADKESEDARVVVTGVETGYVGFFGFAEWSIVCNS
jgi:hypothetical protein